MMIPIKKKKRKSFLSLTIMFVISALWLTPVVAETEIEKCFKNPDACTLDMPNQDNLKSIEAAKQSINDVQTNIHIFLAVIDALKKQPEKIYEQLISVVENELRIFQEKKQNMSTELSEKFATPIKPDNANLSISSFRIAEVNAFPKIPFYIPGTNEFGELFLMPKISDDGFLNYQLDFLDRSSEIENVRDSLSIWHSDINLMIDGLVKIDKWTKVAQEKGITRIIEKTSACIPEYMCLEKVQGIKSTEVVFQIYEDGSTAGRIQLNKGKFTVKYNMSVQSSLLLSAYLTYMRDVGSKEFNLGVMTDDEVKDLFD